MTSKKKKHRKDKKPKNELPDDEQTKKNTEKDSYDIEASDDELDETPSKWYDEFPYEKLPKVPLDEQQIASLRKEAELVLEEETKSYKQFIEECKKSETKWMMTMARSGTSSDKIAALALMVQDSPVHNLSALSSLVNMAKVSKKHQFIIVLDTLTELFVSDLLRPSKKLRRFTKQPLSHLLELCHDNASRRKRLCYWLFEDSLKSIYENFIKSLNEAAHDSVQANREKAVGSMLKLLQNNREEEQLLISCMINKFGDPVHKVASRVVYGLEKVIARFPKKKESILDEVERMLFRSHISKRSQYYGICFLSQFKFAPGDKELCKRLITLYFSFFKACVKTGEIDSRLMGALLVGVNRAYPFASRGKSSEPVIPVEHIDTMYKIVHLAPFKISLQALALLMQISNNDRFYNALYKKLLDKELMQTSHQAIWLNLIMKAIRKDTNDNRRKSFFKRILQVCVYFPVPLICGVLVMLSQLLKHISDVNENLKFSDEVEIKDENESEENLDIISNLKKFEDDDDDERYEDVKTEEELAEEQLKEKPTVSSVGSSWFHRDITGPKMEAPVVEKKYKDPISFDSLHRNPAFAGGEKSVFAELSALAQHFHPTVSLFANKIIKGERIHYTGDPLKDFTMLHFLERFAFKNPKKQKNRGEDKEELFRAVGSERKHYNPQGMKALPVQSEEYLNQTESCVPVDELFLYKYLKEKKIKKGDDKSKNNDNEDSDVSDAESVDSVEFNEYLDELMIGKKAAKNLDFAEDVEYTMKNKKNAKIDDEDESSEDEDIELENDDDEELEAEMDEDVEENNQSDQDEDDDLDDEDDIEDFDDELNEFDDEDDDDGDLPLQAALKKRISRDFGGMAVPTEKFSEMLEEAGKVKSGGSHDLFNKDNASTKQLNWESKRMKQNWRSKNFKRKNNKPNWRDNKKKKF